MGVIKSEAFTIWNLRLLQSFFSPASKREDVFLRIDKEFLDQIGQDLEGDKGFLKAVSEGPSWFPRGHSFVAKANFLVDQRRRHFNPKVNYPVLQNYRANCPDFLDATYLNSCAPLYLPYLAVLVRSSVESSRGYYQQLEQDLNLPSFSSFEMEELEKLWKDLEKWTIQTNEKFGRFHFRRLGGYRHIGVPKSQSILTALDSKRFPHIFVAAQVSSGKILSSEELTRILDTAKENSRLFTAGFNKALLNIEFNSPIRALVNAIYSDWDGTLPNLSTADHFKELDNNQLNNSNEAVEIGISLVIESASPLKLSPHWQIKAVTDTGFFELKHEKNIWEGSFRSTDRAITDTNVEQEDNFWRALEKAASGEDQNFVLRLRGGEDSDVQESTQILTKHLLWIMVPSIDVSSGRPELREGVLPANGAAYLLAPPNNVPSLEKYLELKRPEAKRISAHGVPDDWMLVCIVDCASLSNEQRLIPDGKEQSHPPPHPIRFTGGRSIQRGFSRMYLPYDLPSIELDAIEGAYIESPSGIELEEEPVTLTDEPIPLSPLKRFKIKLAKSVTRSYELVVTSKDGTALGRRRLKVAGLGGHEIEPNERFSLNNLGKPSSNHYGLSGVILDENYELKDEEQSLYKDTLDVWDLGKHVKIDIEQAGIHRIFLDRLARSGHLNYGLARDFLRRLLQLNDVLGEPVFILLELRKLGHIELSTTSRGHIDKVHAVPPTLYSIPVKANGSDVWGITGTLRLEHWLQISNELNVWQAHSLRDEVKFNAWRLLIKDYHGAKSLCFSMGFQLVIQPAATIAHWAGSLEQFKKEALSNTMESVGNLNANAMRFNASSGKFSAPAEGTGWVLWKAKDLDTRMDQLYVLANQQKSKYTFVSDASWGKWLAIDEFARWAAKLPGMSGIYPFPINYNTKKSALWIPARIGLPCILERALILCSGSLPEIVHLQKSEHCEGRLRLSRSEHLPTELLANSLYIDMAVGYWLVYQNVPESIAQLVTKKLGAVLDIA